MNFRVLKFASALLVLLALSVTPVSAQDVPVLTQHVTDQTGTLNASQIAELESELVALEQRKGSQLAVLIVSTTGNEALENYSLAVAEKNKLGRSKTDDGLLLLIAKDDRKARIEVGYGLEGAVPDALASRIIREYLTPKFRQGDYFGGIKDSIQALGKLIDGEALPEPMTADQQGEQPDFVIAGIIGFFIGAIAGVTGMKPMTIRRLGAGGIAAIIASLMFSIGLSTIVAGLIAFLVSGGSSGRYSSGHSGWGSFPGGGGGSSGGGGWSGGGGSFGGGGASGGW
ncbi:MAG TPA: TPM domain-containing protein [Arenimonas sp.]|nr:TPM domain-containing protein [Arenimonas sp.]